MELQENKLEYINFVRKKNEVYSILVPLQYFSFSSTISYMIHIIFQSKTFLFVFLKFNQRLQFLNNLFLNAQIQKFKTDFKKFQL